MQRLVMMAVGLSAAFAAAAPGRALIWGGGPTRDSAAAARTALDTSDVNAMLAFAPGFPKSIESRAVKGLKPGLHIVLLGLCSERDDATLALAVAKSVEPGVYVRRIEFEGSGSCPVLKAPWTQVAATGERTRLDIKVISDKRTLRVLAWLKDDGGDVLDFASQA
jgi:threonine dehydrogenase-like Zn-dependent dehydrogenase